MKIHSRIAILALILILLTTISITSVIFIQLGNVEDEVEKELVLLGIDEAKKGVYNTYLMIEALQHEVEQRLIHDLNAAYALMERSGSLVEEVPLRQWDALNQYDLSVQPLSLPHLVLQNAKGEQKINTDDFIRSVSKVLGVTCTLFQRMNRSGDMLRVSSTVPSATGESAAGTFIPAIHPDGRVDPVISQVLTGDVFVGRAYVVTDWYNTAYMPLYDSDKSEIVGMLYVGERQSDLVALFDAIENVALGDNNHIFMLESVGAGRGRAFVGDHVHDEVTQRRYSEQDNDVTEFFESFPEEDLLAQPKVVKVVRNMDPSALEHSGEYNTVIAYCYFAPWDWVIGVTYNSQYLGSAQARLDLMLDRTLWLVCVVASLWFTFALFIGYRLAGDISKPLEQAVTAFNDVGRGEFEFQLGPTKGYELDQLYKSFNLMVKNLRQVTTSRDQLDREINARRTVEAELLQTVTTLETIIDEAPLSIVVLDLDGIVLLWNPGAERMFGWSKEEVLGKLYPLVHSEILEDLETNRNLVANGLILHAKEAQRFSKAGELLDLLVSAAPMYSKNKGVDSIVVIHENISPLKYVQRQLEEREEEYKLLSAEFKSILDGIQDVISVIGPDMRIRWSNHGQRRWSLCDAKSQQNSCYTLWNKNIEMCNGRPVRDCFATGEIQSAKITSPDGKKWGVKVFPQCDSQGRVVSVIEVASDISEAVTLREEALRSARLASLGELAAGVAHEINNPNGVIMHSAPILKEIITATLPLLDDYSQQYGDFQLGRLPYSRLRDTLQQLPDRIIDGSQRIKFIVEDLKNFVREESDSQQCQSVDLNHVLAIAVRLTNNTIKQATRNFEIHYDETIPLFHGSAQRIEQVIVNLIMNACQALTCVDNKITISTRFDSEKKMVELEVFDQGAGIKEEDLIKVTNPFFTTKRETGGTGLGLSISSRIVEEHLGLLQIESTVNIGTKIVVSLPCVEEIK
jgi:PAS domain S-box-containing protein